MLLRAAAGAGLPTPRKQLHTSRVRQCLLTPGARDLALGKAGKTRQNIQKRHLIVILDLTSGQLQALGRIHPPDNEKAGKVSQILRVVQRAGVLPSTLPEPHLSPPQPAASLATWNSIWLNQ
jgi:hypothetical protein